MDDVLYRKINNYIGWGLFAFATLMYLLTLEPTVSFWDAGERIAVSYKLQIGHPPGAPLYQMMARIFSLFALGETSRVAFWINTMSAVAGGMAVMFLFWTINMLAKKLVANSSEMTNTKALAIFGSGIVGALTLTFSDSFWFTAVEAEVYVTSAFLTAFVFWAILKWEARAHEPDSHKWLVLIFYIIGLSIGVHLLNLLAIPAIVFVYYFKKYTPSIIGLIFTGFVAVALLYFVQSILIPGILNLDWQFERFFVNSMGLPFHSGTVIFFVLLIAGIVYGLYYTQKHKKIVSNTILLCFTFIVIGYSSFFMLVIRSNAHVPINENAPKDALSMKAYLGREQYGAWPLLYGPYYNAPITNFEDGVPVWAKNPESGRYEIINPRTRMEPVYDPKFKTLFPRMWSSRGNHPQAYQSWGNVEGRPFSVTHFDGSREVLNKPTFFENVRFFISYQINHMYLRYLFWNFSGRQNDIQGHGSLFEGNWITGVPLIDNTRLGPQTNLPESITSNPGHNRYYFLPFLLGVIGFLFQIRRKPEDALVVGLLFFMTGIAIIIYLNQTPFQPRERDYSYIGSFYAFSIWVGLGVLGIIDAILGKAKKYWSNEQKRLGIPVVAGIVMLATLLVPVVMAFANWDDHDRSGRYGARDVAINYLESCAPNAIIFTNGDNDTFPLWYAQEVEGIRTDIKVVNMSLLNTDWYIDNMLRRKTYDADPVPFTLLPHQYRDGTRDYARIETNPRSNDFINLNELMRDVRNDRMLEFDRSAVFTTNRFRLPVDSALVVDNGTVAPEDAHLIVDAVDWIMPGRHMNKNHLMALNFIAANNWERPVYFAITTGRETYMGLEDYFQLDGMAYRLVPIKSQSRQMDIGRINTRILYDNIMNKFEWGNMYDPNVYLDEHHIRLTTSYRNIMRRLAGALIAENDTLSAINVLDKAMRVMPEYNVPYNYFTILIAENYFEAGAFDKANEISARMIDIHADNLQYYYRFPERRLEQIRGSIQESLAMMQYVSYLKIQIAENHYENGAIEEANVITYQMIEVFEDNLRFFSRLNRFHTNIFNNNFRENLAMMQHIGYIAELYQQDELAERAGNIFDTYYGLFERR